MIKLRLDLALRPALHFRFLLLSFLLLSWLAAPRPAAAWGPTGHRVVGRLAESYLSATARQAVESLLGPDSLTEVTTWADDIRPDPASAPFENWHYVNIEDGVELNLDPGNHQGELLRTLEAQRTVLCDPSRPREQRRDAVRWLAHLIGDLHQPLHIGRASDRGANYVLVLWQNQPSNLHEVWDDKMIETTRLSFSEFVEFLDPVAAPEQTAWKQGSFLDWARESHALRKAAYETGDGRLGYKYSWTHMPTLRQRLQQAGVRLAAVLEGCLGGT